MPKLNNRAMDLFHLTVCVFEELVGGSLLGCLTHSQSLDKVTSIYNGQGGSGDGGEAITPLFPPSHPCLKPKKFPK